MKTVKKLVALLLCAVTCLALFACKPQSSDSGKKDYSQFAGIVADPKTWYEEFMNLPVANANMTEQELRQLCVDAFEANMTFCWTPNAPITYTYELLDRYSDVSLPTGNAYSGLFYATGIKDATCGNIWKILPYYDLETGVIDVEAMGDNAVVLNNLSSACSYGAMQAWNRVSNSHGLNGMNSYNQYDSNIVPVGPYTYNRQHYKFDWLSMTASNDVIAFNGMEVMLESLAQMKMADGLYSSSSYHVMMCAEDPVVVRNADGTVNGLESYVLVHEQGADGTHSDKYNYDQSNGVPMRPLGTTYNKFTFQRLLNTGYVPFTLKEFIGQDPIEPGEVWLGKGGRLENGTDLTVRQINNQTLCANYNICTILVEVKSPDGTVLTSFYPPALTNPAELSQSMYGLLSTEKLASYADGKNTIHLSARLSNGELLEAFYTTLKVD